MSDLSAEIPCTWRVHMCLQPVTVVCHRRGRPDGDMAPTRCARLAGQYRPPARMRTLSYMIYVAQCQSMQALPKRFRMIAIELTF